MKQETINKIIEGIEIKKDELVLLHFWGDDNEREILHMFEYAIVICGATPIAVQQSKKINSKLFNNMSSEGFCSKYFELFKLVDTVIDICMYRPVVPSDSINPHGMKAYKTYMNKVFQLLMNKKKFVQLRVPTVANAAESSLPEAEFIQRMETAYDIDYKKLKIECMNRIEKLKDVEFLSLFTGESCKLNLKLSGRKWIIDAGDGDLPCGEIAIAPIEEYTNGDIFFETLYIEGVGVFENINLIINDGKITHSNNDEVNEFLQKLPKDGNVICELGMGMNSNVTELCGYTVLDEKMAGTVHIGIGMNIMFGGKNNAQIHMDLVCHENWRVEVSNE